MTSEIETREARWGERMIELRIRFWTDGLAGQNGSIRPKHAWSAGVVRMAVNEAHGISARHPRTFNSLLDLPMAIERVLAEHGVKLHRSRRMQKYLT